MKKLFSLLFILAWCALLAGLAGYYILAAPKEAAFSREENRMLHAMPAVSLESFLNGTLSDGLESWLLDRFPERNGVISRVDAMKDAMSAATYEEYLLIAEGSADPLDTEDYTDDIGQLLGELEGGKTPEETPAPVLPAPPEEPEPDPAQEDPDAVMNPAAPPEEDPPIVPKSEARAEDYPKRLGVYAELDGETVVYQEYDKDNVLALTAVLNQYAGLLPEGGKLLFTMVPQSATGNRFVNSSRNGRFYSTFGEVINAFGLDNVYAFDAAAILSDAVLEDRYVYFRSDMHWTPYGSYLVYCEMAARAGKTPCDYDGGFDHTLEAPFLGTYYRDNPTDYMRQHADELDLLMPRFPLEWRRVTGKDTYTLIDFLDFDAAENDRYTVYLGGPAGPWTYTESENGESENCLVLTDSFGLGFIPFVTTGYKQVHYYDPRYFDQETVGYTVAEMIEKYQIRDIYVVIGDLHSFDSGFIISTAQRQLGLE